MKESGFCLKCGAKLEAGEEFCGTCGFDTDSLESLSPISQAYIQPAEVEFATIPPPQNKSPASTQKTVIIILAVILGVLVLIGGGVFLWFSQSGRSSGNPTNDGSKGATGENQQVVALPSYSLNEGNYTASQKVEINKPSGEEIKVYFTIDGTEPTDKSSRYESAIVLNVTTTLKSIAIDKNGNKSGIKTAAYTITIPQQATTQPVTTQQPTTTPATTPAATPAPEVNEWQQFENYISGTWKWTDASGFTLYYQFSNGTLIVTDGGSDYYNDSYRSTVSTGTNGTIGTIYSGSQQLSIDCNPLGDNAIYIDGYLCTYVP